MAGLSNADLRKILEDSLKRFDAIFDSFRKKNLENNEFDSSTDQVRETEDPLDDNDIHDLLEADLDDVGQKSILGITEVKMTDHQVVVTQGASCEIGEQSTVGIKAEAVTQVNALQVSTYESVKKTEVAKIDNLGSDCSLNEEVFGKVHGELLKETTQAVTIQQQVDCKGLQGIREIVVEVPTLSMVEQPVMKNQWKLFEVSLGWYVTQMRSMFAQKEFTQHVRLFCSKNLIYAFNQTEPFDPGIARLANQWNTHTCRILLNFGGYCLEGTPTLNFLHADLVDRDSYPSFGRIIELMSTTGNMIDHLKTNLPITNFQIGDGAHRNSTLICVPLMTELVDHMMFQMHKAKEFDDDLVEVRVDFLKFFIPRQDLDILIKQALLPTLAPYRSRWENGQYDGNYSKQQEALCLAMELGADYIDIELKVAHDFFISLPGERPENVEIIVPSHNYGRTPSVENPGILVAKIQVIGADIVKIATTTSDIVDNARTFQVLVHFPTPMIGFVTGEKGLMSKILAPKFGEFFTLGSLKAGVVSFLGQPNVKELLDLYNMRHIGPYTKVHGIIGNPISLNRSPHPYNAAFKSTEFNGIYLPLLVDDASNFITTYSSPALAGYSCTIPLKEARLKCCGEVDSIAKAIGAHSSMIRRSTNGKLICYIFYYFGAIAAIKEGLRASNGVPFGDAISASEGSSRMTAGLNGFSSLSNRTTYGSREDLMPRYVTGGFAVSAVYDQLSFQEHGMNFGNRGFRNGKLFTKVLVQCKTILLEDYLESNWSLKLPKFWRKVDCCNTVIIFTKEEACEPSSLRTRMFFRKGVLIRALSTFMGLCTSRLMHLVN